MSVVEADASAEGVIYVCVERDGTYAKVGWASSLDHVRTRSINHQIGNPRPLTTLIVGPGDLAAEAALHETFRDQAVRGEWFRVEGTVAELVAHARPLPRRFGSGRPRAEREAAQDWLAASLRAGSQAAGEVSRAARVAGHSLKTLRRAADALGVVRAPPGGGRGCTWRLPSS